MPSQITLTVHPTISFRQQSYRSFRARLKKTNAGQSQENLPHPISSVPFTLLETKLLGGWLMPQSTRLTARASFLWVTHCGAEKACGNL